ncbi:GNAT family N-acetyltransferase [Kitasatospora sp. NPDC091335]|uniref:GNAT family N-acetyltransferase n=1 Tax=Kitasatospora sp. NPDC091335 TaxID=3364085 RepID=UPI003823CED3
MSPGLRRCPHGHPDPPTLLVRPAGPADRSALTGIDTVAAAGDPARRAAVRRWCEQGSAVLAEDAPGPLGYRVLEHTFFGQGFVTPLMVAPGERGRGIGARLLHALEAACTTPKLFTSTNVSNQPMQRLLHRAGWQAAGILHGLDEADPELFHLRPPQRPAPGTGPTHPAG